MKLSSRLLLLIVVCLVPIVGTQFYAQYRLHQRQRDAAATLALHQVELANSDLASIANGLLQLAAAVAASPDVKTAGPGCAAELDAVQRSAPTVLFFAALGRSGDLLCASRSGPTAWNGRPPAWVIDLLTHPGDTLGRYTRLADGRSFLPFAVRPHGPQGKVALILAGLDLDWLSRHLRQIRIGPADAPMSGVLYITDRDGSILGRSPAGLHERGKPLPAELRDAVNAPKSGVRTVPGADHGVRLVAQVPATVEPVGLAAIESLPLADVMPGLLQATGWSMLPVLVVALLALALAWLIGRYFISRPTRYLLSAAQRWRDGDLSARARRTRSGSEFAILAESFNAMASTLEARELERRLQSELLEAQVAERTRALSDSNNRLQVEIAERAKTEAALHQSQKLQAVGQLAGGIAHDFNNMLATVLGSLELMERRVAQSVERWTEEDAQRLARLIERATGAVLRGSQLTAQLLAFSRRQQLAPRSTDLNRLVSDLVTLVSPTLGRRITLTTELAGDVWPALVDPGQLEAAILNCCLNARDAMPEGGELRITTSNQRIAGGGPADELAPGDYVCVAIADTGAGMSAEVLRRAFDPFFTTKGPAGAGLGLSQVYGMARQSGGTARIASTPNEGTVVTLLLPRAAAAAATEARSAPAEPGQGRPASLVLLVDDDAAVRQVAVEMLRDRGCEVMQASGGAEALALLDASQRVPDLVLLDYAMPAMNGVELARALRARGLRAPIALVTGYAELSERETENTPLNAFLRKPYTIRELDGLLEQLRRSAREPAAERHHTA